MQDTVHKQIHELIMGRKLLMKNGWNVYNMMNLKIKIDLGVSIKSKTTQNENERKKKCPYNRKTITKSSK